MRREKPRHRVGRWIQADAAVGATSARELHQAMPARIPPLQLREVPEKVPLDVPEKVPVDVPERVPVDVPEKVPVEPPQKVPADPLERRGR